MSIVTFLASSALHGDVTHELMECVLYQAPAICTPAAANLPANFSYPFSRTAEFFLASSFKDSTPGRADGLNLGFLTSFLEPGGICHSVLETSRVWACLLFTLLFGGYSQDEKEAMFVVSFVHLNTMGSSMHDLCMRLHNATDVQMQASIAKFHSSHVWQYSCLILPHTG